MSDFTVLDLLDLDLKTHNHMGLSCIAGRSGLSAKITTSKISRPGLPLTGFFEEFASESIQVFGHGEQAYLRKLENEGVRDNIQRLLDYHVPCCIFSDGCKPTSAFLEIAEETGTATLVSSLPSVDLSRRLYLTLDDVFAPTETIHGVLVEVYGIGVLILGDSGVGKSETALELVERGHRLVADDIVELSCVNGNTLIGRGANKYISHHMEIRGLGIINVSQLYGVGAIRDQKEIQLVVKLEAWDQNKVYDRLGTEVSRTDLLGVKIPYIELPVKPGRNMPIIIEAAAMNERLKSMGYFSAREFNQNILKWIESGEAQTAYYGSEDFY